MNNIPLSDYVAEHGQTETGRRSGLTQGAIWQMLQSARNIVVSETSDGSIVIEEIKRLSKPTEQQTAA